MAEAFFHQLQKNIETLVTEGKFSEAFEECVKILKLHPEQEEILQLKKSIEKKLLEQNKEEIKEGIKEAKKLEKEDAPEKALKKLKDLLKLSPNNEKLRRLYLKIQSKYKEKLEEEQEKFIEQKTKEFEELIKKDDIPQLLQSLNSLQNEYTRNKPIQVLVKKTKQELIQKEIEEKRDLLNSTKFDDIKSFIQDLKNIDEKSAVINKLEQYAKSRQMGSQIETFEEFVYTSKHDLKTLMKLEKYEQAATVAVELLETDPNNSEAAKILKKAEGKAFTQNRKEVVKNIKTILPALEAQYKQNKQNFVKI